MVIFLKLFRFASKLVSETLNNTISYKKKKKKKKKKNLKKKKNGVFFNVPLASMCAIHDLEYL